MYGGTSKRCQAGFSLLEILITMVVLSIGLLGVAGMQVNGLRNNHAAYTKTQATNLALDMAERIRANPRGQANYVGFNSDNAPADPGCINAGCSPAELSQFDKFEWSQPLNAETKPLLPAGRGLITQNGEEFSITLVWREVAYEGMQRDDCDLDGLANDMACFQLSFTP